jgi:DNA-binding transcriptional LysR family regulator
VPALRRLEYFIAVATERNFTRAAAKLHVAQPALSRQVRQLEEELGVELLHRTTHDFELTEAGRYLVDHGPAVLAAADELWRTAAEFGQGIRGTVVLGYSTSSGYETAPRLLETLAEREPNLTVEAHIESSAEILRQVVDGGLDVGIVRSAVTGDGLQAWPLRFERQGLLMRRDHRLAVGAKAVRIAELSDEALLLHPRYANPGHYDAVLALCRAAGVTPRVHHRQLSLDVMHMPVIEGKAVAIVGQSTLTGIPVERTWLPLAPSTALEVSLVAREAHRSMATERLIAKAQEIAVELGWRPDAAPA